MKNEAQDRSTEQLSLGTPIRVFKAGLRNRLVMLLCGVILIGSGLFLAFYPEGLPAFGSVLASFGGIIVACAFYLGRQRLLISSDGILLRRGGKEESCRWEQLQMIVSSQVKEGIVTSRRCSLVKKDDSRIELRELAVGEYDALLALLRQTAEAHGIPWIDEDGKKREK